MPLLPQVLQKMTQMTVLQARAAYCQVHALVQFLLQELPVSLPPPPPPPLSASRLQEITVLATHILENCFSLAHVQLSCHAYCRSCSDGMQATHTIWCVNAMKRCDVSCRPQPLLRRQQQAQLNKRRVSQSMVQHSCNAMQRNTHLIQHVLTTAVNMCSVHAAHVRRSARVVLFKQLHDRLIPFA